MGLPLFDGASWKCSWPSPRGQARNISEQIVLLEILWDASFRHFDDEDQGRPFWAKRGIASSCMGRLGSAAGQAHEARLATVPSRCFFLVFCGALLSGVLVAKIREGNFG